MSTQSRCIQYNRKILTLWKLNGEEYPRTNITTYIEWEGIGLKAGWTVSNLIQLLVQLKLGIGACVCNQLINKITLILTYI
jgi:hypothetical protein